MGLDTTHDCWHGGYTSFMFWREKLAEAAGFLPLAQMAGYTSLGISWKKYEHDPLVVLLNHSDCDGSIASKDCGPLADRLTELLPKIHEEENGRHWREKTERFIAGLREAAAAGEDVEFR